VERVTSSILGPLLDWLGINPGQQLMYATAACLAFAAVFALRYRRHDGVLSILFLTMTLALLLVLFTASPAVRGAALVLLIVATAAAFVRDHVRRRRPRAERTS
jgi:hypothetical protein